MSAEKLTVKFYLAPGVRNRKFYLAPGMRNGKIYLAPNDSYEKIYLAVKGLTLPGRSHLRSAARGELSVPRSKREAFGTRSFNISGPKTWNTLPLTA